MAFEIDNLAEDYGFDVRDAGASLRFAYALRADAQPPRPIAGPGDYVARCRAVARRLGRRDLEKVPGQYQPERVDGRLVAAGLNLCPPERWVRGELDAFLGYWKRAAASPATVGSSHNRASPEQVARAWRAGVPALAVRTLGTRAWPGLDGRGPVRPCRGAARERLRVAARGAGRRAARHVHDHVRKLSSKAAYALGRLCPELARVALAGLVAEFAALEAASKAAWGALLDAQKAPENRDALQAANDASEAAAESVRAFRARPVRIRDLDWAAVARAQAELAGDATGRVRAALARGKRRDALLAGRGAGWLCPAYPEVSLDVAAALCLGRSPVELAAEAGPDARLTRREAHEWALAGAPAEVLSWWCGRTLPLDCPRVRSWPVARWLADVARRGHWELLTHERTFEGPAGERGHARYLDKVDELDAQDLVAGTRTGVEPAFRRAAGRFGEAAMARAREEHRTLAPLPPGWRLFRAARHLDTPAKLAREGDELRHCVGGYSPYVADGRSVILGLDVCGHRSTVELSPSGEVRQHRGPRNAEPHPLCRRALEVLVRRLPGRAA
jgi:hypothetical protein